ncbi:MAG: 2-hydroxyacyl-CoA dehydratase [Deltaproteobacteria bacterium]|nr:2-hydroxyacyl-CoA dehydratase [Deltaproteobacteria bacterium]
MQHYFKNVLNTLSAVSSRHKGMMSPQKKFALEVARLGYLLYSTEKPVAWCGVATPFELLHAMGVTSCFVEYIGAVLSAVGDIDSMLETAERHGYSTDICSYHRSVHGAALRSMMPTPDFLIATTSPCSSGFATIEQFAEYYSKDLFAIHVPQNSDPESVSYLAAQFKDMTAFAAKHTGRSIDSNNLRNVIKQSNKARSVMLDVYEMAKAIPTPVRSKDMINLYYLMSLIMGSEYAVEMAEAYRDDFMNKMKNKKQGLAGEQIRLMWYQNRIQFKNPLERMLENEFKAVVVVDELNDITWDPIDPDDPYEGLAKRILNNPLVESLDKRIEHLIKLAQTYHVDGMINPCHWGCLQGTGARGLVEAGLKKAGIPVLNLEVDCVDAKNFSEGQARTRLQAFIEMLLERKATADP